MSSTRLWRPGKFVIVGLLNTLVDFGVFNLLLFAVPLSFAGDATLYGALSYCCGVVNSYFLNRYWTFRFTEERRFVFARFVAVNLVALGIHAGAVWLAELCWQGAWVNLGKAAGVGVGTVWSYLAYGRWVFRSSPR